jgi:hypothetical protein
VQQGAAQGKAVFSSKVQQRRLWRGQSVLRTFYLLQQISKGGSFAHLICSKERQGSK